MADLFRIIAEEVLAILREKHVTGDVTLEPHTSLVEDLGLDSLAFVDLTLRLETRLRLSELPLQDWVDAEGFRPGPQYTLLSLRDFAEEILANSDAR